MTSQQALINEVSLNDSGAFRAENEFNDLHSSKKVVGNEDIFTQPPGKSLGTMNYSPKHSKKPSSLGSRNMKKLSLNLSDASDSARSDETDSEVTRSNHNGSRQLSKVKRSLTVTIPSNECSEKGTPNLSLVTPSVTTTPGVPPQILPSNIDSPDSRLGLSHGFRSPKLGINYKFPSNNVIGNIDADAGDAHAHEGEISFANTSYDLQSPLFGEVPNTSIISKFTQVSLYDNYPEELQESGPLDAYPNGPANVLNDSLFLYSDPEKGRTHVDINDYDLVINVAKECNDLGNEFDDLDGEKEYMYVPWSHTSSISNQLPKLTRKIKEYDDSDEYNKRRRKILIHCHCGVSRSACVVVAYFMLKFNIGVNEAYELLKSGTSNVSVETNRRLTNDGYTIEACDKICPNMSLIFELMEFGDSLRLAKEA